VHEALIYEEKRQAEILRSGGTIVQETRGWVDERAETASQRSKEHAHDYRYFPEPDLPPLKLSRMYVEGLRARLPELPEARKQRLLSLGVSAHEAETLTEARERADYYEDLAKAIGLEPARSAKLAANWTLGEVGRWCNANGREIFDFPIDPGRLAELVRMVEDGKVTGQVGKDVFEQMVSTGKSAPEIVEAAGLAQISGADDAPAQIRAIAANEKAVADYHAGKGSAIGFLMGQVMRQTGGRANPQMVQELLLRELGNK
jgi:aspartyl-tRNA(Asn)/glutamyl-tRNA(Gln) amidotransferase subunit B